MKNIMLYIIIFWLSGCGFVFQNFDQCEYRGLTYGMSQEEVPSRSGSRRKKV